MGELMKKMQWVCIPALLCFVSISCGGGFYHPGRLNQGRGLRSPLTPPSQEGVEKDHWKVEKDITLYYFARGQGTPVLVIYGGPGIPPSGPWKGLEPLENAYQFYYYHQRGCGESAHPVDRFSSKNYYRNMVELNSILGMSAQLADIERIRRICGVDKLILVGHSFGGFMAALYAAEFPEHVEKMVLVSPAGVLTMPPLGGGMDRVREYLPDEMKKGYDDFRRRYFSYGTIFSKSEAELSALNSEYNRYYIRALESRGIPVPAGLAELKGKGGWMVHAIYFSLGRSYDFRPALTRVTAPALVIHGEKDIFPEEVSREYAKILPRGKLVVIPGASHFAFAERPEEFAELVGNFFKGAH